MIPFAGVTEPRGPSLLQIVISTKTNDPAGGGRPGHSEARVDRRRPEQVKRSSGTASAAIRMAWSLAAVPERLQTSTLERILRALEALTGQDVTLSDVLAWEDVPE